MITKEDFETAGTWEEAITDAKNRGMKFPLEIDEDIFYYFLAAVPPLLGNGTETESVKRALTRRGMPADLLKRFFLCGEPTDTHNDMNLHRVFVELENGKYYYIGEMGKREWK